MHDLFDFQFLIKIVGGNQNVSCNLSSFYMLPGGALPEKSSASSAGNVVYSYVSPEDCQCECHDHGTSHVKESDPKRGTNGKS